MHGRLHVHAVGGLIMNARISTGINIHAGAFSAEKKRALGKDKALPEESGLPQPGWPFFFSSSSPSTVSTCSSAWWSPSS